MKRNIFFSIILFFLSFHAVKSTAQIADSFLTVGLELAKKGEVDQAVAYFVTAAELGNTTAMFHMGQAHEKGIGVDSSMVKAIYWHQRAADSGYKQSYLPLGVLYYNNKNIPEAEKYLLEAAKFDKNAYGIIGYIYYQEEKYNNAYKWFNRAVKVGDADAMFYLGEMYLDGNGVEYSEDRAVQYFVRAARKGNEQAKEMLEDLGYEYRTPSEQKKLKKAEEEAEAAEAEFEDEDRDGLGDLDFDEADTPKREKKEKKSRKSKSAEKDNSTKREMLEDEEIETSSE